MPRSPPRNPITLRTTSSNPGTARRDWSAARSAGCSHETAEISGNRWRGRAAGIVVMLCSRLGMSNPTVHDPGCFNLHHGPGALLPGEGGGTEKCKPQRHREPTQSINVVVLLRGISVPLCLCGLHFSV